MTPQQTDQPSPEFKELVQRVLDKESSLEDVAILNRTLPQSPEALRYFVKMRMIHSHLLDLMGGDSSQLVSFHDAADTDSCADAQGQALASLSDSRAQSRSWIKKVAIASAALILFSLIAPGIYRKILSKNAYQIVAIYNTSEFERGDWVTTQQSYHLTEGSIQLNSPDGNHLTIQAPAKFAIDSQQKITLTEGRIWAELDGPPLEIHTPQGLVQDLGTIFGIDQSSQKITRIDVLDGKIQLTSPSKKSTTVAKGNALISESGQWPPVETYADASLYSSNLHKAIGIAFSDNTTDTNRIISERPMSTRWTVAGSSRGKASLNHSPVSINWVSGALISESLADSVTAALFRTHLYGGRWKSADQNMAKSLGFIGEMDGGIVIRIENLRIWLDQIGATGYRIEALRNSGVPNVQFLPISAHLPGDVSALETQTTTPADILSPNYPEPADNHPGGRSITAFESTFSSDTLILHVPAGIRRDLLNRSNISAVRIIPRF
ncbi:MAG: FecR domain-containing protein [Akkermansiaceae bacterium]